MSLMPLMKFERSRRTGPPSSMSGKPAQQLLEHDPDLEPRQARAEAEVLADAEREVLVRGAARRRSAAAPRTPPRRGSRDG